MKQKDALKLENQVCFPLYACSRAVVKQYKPLLGAIGLTYTQYIVMVVLWGHGPVNVKQLGQYLYLDSGTLTPLLKKMEAKGLLTRQRSNQDERNLIVSVTGRGAALQAQAVGIPAQLGCRLPLTQEETATLRRLLYKILEIP